MTMIEIMMIAFRIQSVSEVKNPNRRHKASALQTPTQSSCLASLSLLGNIGKEYGKQGTQNGVFLLLKAGGTYSYQCSLRG
jgi:hypothetical protein